MAFVVVYDACVLYRAPVRDLLVRIALKGLVRARWSEQILDECFRSIKANRPRLDPSALNRTRELMCQAVPDCLVGGYEGIIDGILLPDQNDRHVVAAAIRSGAQAIVTYNLKDFPSVALDKYDLEAKHPDDFVVDIIGLSPGTVAQIITEQAAALKHPPLSIGELLDKLREHDLEQSVALLREMFGRSGPTN
jgi:hypothetical protein